MRRSALISMVLCLVLASCGNKGGKTVSEGPATRSFPSVSAPGMLTEQSEILDYVTMHFWDGFAPEGKQWLDDSTHIAGIDRIKLEEQIGSYTTLLSMVPLGKAISCIEGFYSQAVKLEMENSASSGFEETVKLMAKYLYNENSPVRNEDIYGALAQKLATSKYIDEDLRPSYEFEARVCALNKVGTKATNIKLTDRKGQEHDLYGIKAPWTLLFFTNPGCPACAEIITGLNASQKIRNMVDGGMLKIVNAYIDDDLAAWKEHVDDYPASWLTGFDKDLVIREEMTYNVRAIPSLYMLDKDKTVLLKDAPAEKILEFIENIEE